MRSPKFWTFVSWNSKFFKFVRKVPKTEFKILDFWVLFPQKSKTFFWTFFFFWDFFSPFPAWDPLVMIGSCRRPPESGAGPFPYPFGSRLGKVSNTSLVWFLTRNTLYLFTYLSCPQQQGHPRCCYVGYSGRRGVSRRVCVPSRS